MLSAADNAPKATRPASILWSALRVDASVPRDSSSKLEAGYWVRIMVQQVVVRRGGWACRHGCPGQRVPTRRAAMARPALLVTTSPMLCPVLPPSTGSTAYGQPSGRLLQSSTHACCTALAARGSPGHPSRTLWVPRPQPRRLLSMPRLNRASAQALASNGSRSWSAQTQRNPWRTPVRSKRDGAAPNAKARPCPT